MICKTCKYHVRGKNHETGEHHKTFKPTVSKEQIKLNKRAAFFNADKMNLKNDWHDQHREPGSLQLGKCR